MKISLTWNISNMIILIYFVCASSAKYCGQSQELFSLQNPLLIIPSTREELTSLCNPEVQLRLETTEWPHPIYRVTCQQICTSCIEDIYGAEMNPIPGYYREKTFLIFPGSILGPNITFSMPIFVKLWLQHAIKHVRDGAGLYVLMTFKC